jgi:hypothetical protein
MKLAVVVGGWHFPADFYDRLPSSLPGAECFVVAHRNPELAIVREEKLAILNTVTGPLADLDREMYDSWLDVADLKDAGWHYAEAPNTIGDWGFFNQWLEKHDFRKYDVILNCHDDNYLRFGAGSLADALQSFDSDWLLLANGKYPEAPEGYVRGSFEFWKPELLEMLGGRIDLGNVSLTREGKTDTPQGLHALSAWNDTGVPLRDFLVQRGLTNRIQYLSPYYRVSPWVIEGERGFLHYQAGAPWSFEAGLRAYPLEAPPSVDRAKGMHELRGSEVGPMEIAR